MPPLAKVARATLVAPLDGSRRPARSALVSLALHGLLLALAAAISSGVAARHANRRVKLTFYDTPDQAEPPPQAAEPAAPPPSPGPPPPPPRRVYVRKIAPPPDLPPAPPAPDPTPYDQPLVAPPPCTDPNGCNQNPGAANGVEGGTGIPGGGDPNGTGNGLAKAPERPRPMYLSPGMTRPRLLSGDQPRYTEQARRAHVEGDVTVRIEVLPDGRVGEVRILAGLALLDEEVTSKVRRWRFSAPTYRGAPCSVYLIQRITFRLED